MEFVAQNWLRVNEIVAEEAVKSGRDSSSVKVMAVTKLHSADEIRPLLDAGCRLCGENRLAEAQEKRAVFEREELSLHLIGHLQSNKAKAAVSCFDAVDSIDSLSTLKKVESYAAAQEKPLSVLLEYNCSGEETKHGFRSESDLLEALTKAASFRWVRINGLMTMAALGADEREARKAFEKLRLLRDKCRWETGLPLDELSMGMSSDFRWAVAEGSTVVRIGTALFQGVSF